MSKKGKLHQSASDKIQYKAYNARGSFEKNKIARLERVVKTQPNNVEAKAALDRMLAKGANYTRNRRHAGHTTKGMYNVLGFTKNQPSIGMLKSKMDIRNYFGGVYNFSPSLPANTPLRHGITAEAQLVALGYDKPKRKAYRGRR